MKKVIALLTEFWLILLGRLSATAPAEASCHTLIPTGDLKVALDDLIDDLHGRKLGKIRVTKHGTCRDENGFRVPAICMRAGEVHAHNVLFVQRIVYEQAPNQLHLLLVRSDSKTPLFRLFPHIGTSQDWRILEKCAQHFFRYLKIGDDAVAQRSDNFNGMWRSAEHLIGVFSYREHFAAAAIQRDNGRFPQYDAFALYIDNNRSGSQIYANGLA